jgi:hypothetical protein
MSLLHDRHGQLAVDTGSTSSTADVSTIRVYLIPFDLPHVLTLVEPALRRKFGQKSARGALWRGSWSAATVANGAPATRSAITQRTQPFIYSVVAVDQCFAVYGLARLVRRCHGQRDTQNACATLRDDHTSYCACKHDSSRKEQ